MTSFRDAWMRGLPEAARALPGTVLGAEDRRASAERAAAQPLDPRVAHALRTQNAGATGEATVALAHLDDPRVCFVVAGQQVGLFGGPLYSLHKACGAIRLARRLRDETKLPVFPVFWLQSEDHDVRELATARLVDGGGASVRVEVPVDASHRSSVTHTTRIDGIAAARALAESTFDGLPFAAEAVERMEAAWRDDVGWVDAFSRFLRDLLGAEGLLVFSPRTAELAPLAAPLHRWAIHEHEAIARALAERTRELAAAGFGEQVPLRPDCALSFVHPHGAGGGRYRLRCTDRGWEAAGDGLVLDTATLDEHLDARPLRFSTSALLRPLLQDRLLPVAAWLGGGAELAYLAQMEPLYAMQGIVRPLAAVRPHVRWLTEDVRRVLTTHELSAKELGQPMDALAERLGDASAVGPDPARIRRALDTALADALASVEPELLGLDPNLASAVRKTRATIGFAFGKLEARVARARLYADRETLQSVQSARAWLAPDGVAQERSLSPLSLIARIGAAEVVRLALAAADPVAYAESCRHSDTCTDIEVSLP